MKKLIALVLALVCVLSLVGCSNSSIKEIDKAAKIEVVQYDIFNREITVTEETSIKHIVDNLNSLKLKKMGNSDPTVFAYKLTFYNAGEERIDIISILISEWVGVDVFFTLLQAVNLTEPILQVCLSETNSNCRTE